MDGYFLAAYALFVVFVICNLPAPPEKYKEEMRKYLKEDENV